MNWSRLEDLEQASKNGGHASYDRWYHWKLIYAQPSPVAGKDEGWVYARTSDQAMQFVREAALADLWPRPFGIEIKRHWLVEDKVTQHTKETTK